MIATSTDLGCAVKDCRGDGPNFEDHLVFMLITLTLTLHFLPE